MNSAISYLRPHGSQIVIYIYIYFLGGAHFLFFFVFLIFVSSLSHHFSTLFLSLCSTSLPPNPWLIANDCPNHKPIVQITNPWLICDWPQISHRPSLRWPKASKPWRAMVSNGPMAIHVIWTNPQSHTQFEATHGNPRWSEPTHGNLNPNHGEPRPPSAHDNLNPTSIWSLQAHLEREEKLSLREEERRERDGSASGFAGGDRKSVV